MSGLVSLVSDRLFCPDKKAGALGLSYRSTFLRTNAGWPESALIHAALIRILMINHATNDKYIQPSLLARMGFGTVNLYK